MDLPSLFYVSQSLGLCLNPQEHSSVEIGLIQRKTTENIYDLKFWGKIMGTQSDYVIVKGFLPTTEGIPERKYFFSTLTSPELQQFPAVSTEKRKIIASMNGRLTGDPSLPLTENEEEDTPETDILREIDRLVCMVEEIDTELSVIPNGAYIVVPNRRIIKNASFTGLSWEKARQLEQYFHFRYPKAEAKQLLLRSTDILRSEEYLDGVATDLKGTWTIRTDAFKEIVILQNFVYPGAWAYHKPETSEYGYCYFGDGVKNSDLIYTL